LGKKLFCKKVGEVNKAEGETQEFVVKVYLCAA